MNQIDRTFDDARSMGGASWPSADCTRWALESLAKKLGERVETLAKEGFRAGEMKRELMRFCGLLPGQQKGTA